MRRSAAQDIAVEVGNYGRATSGRSIGACVCAEDLREDRRHVLPGQQLALIRMLPGIGYCTGRCSSIIGFDY
jgi:hypothetical protein